MIYWKKNSCVLLGRDAVSPDSRTCRCVGDAEAPERLSPASLSRPLELPLFLPLTLLTGSGAGILSLDSFPPRTRAPRIAQGSVFQNRDSRDWCAHIFSSTQPPSPPVLSFTSFWGGHATPNQTGTPPYLTRGAVRRTGEDIFKGARGRGPS